MKRIDVSGAGTGFTDYTIKVSGELVGVQDTLNGSDSVQNGVANGSVGPGTDSYKYSGRVVTFETENPAGLTVKKDGRTVAVENVEDPVASTSTSGGSLPVDPKVLALGALGVLALWWWYG